MACSEQVVTADNMVTLKSGLVASLCALMLLWELEDRGFSLEPIGDRLRVQPSERLTAEDRVVIRQYKTELIALVAYVEAIQ